MTGKRKNVQDMNGLSEYDTKKIQDVSIWVDMYPS